MKKKAAAACVAAMAAVSLPMGIVPIQPVQADLITDVIGGLQVKSALSKQIKHYDTTKEGQSEIYQSVTKQTGVLHNEYYNERLASIMNRLSASIAQTDPSIKTLPYRWYVSPDTTFNAACTMGHVMVVNKGMFDLVSNDDEIAVVGTINLDYRSLYLHFENGVWFYKNKVIQDILSDFQETLNYCDPISIDFCRNRNIVIRAFQSILRLFAPLL